MSVVCVRTEQSFSGQCVCEAAGDQMSVGPQILPLVTAARLQS